MATEGKSWLLIGIGEFLLLEGNLWLLRDKFWLLIGRFCLLRVKFWLLRGILRLLRQQALLGVACS